MIKCSKLSDVMNTAIGKKLRQFLSGRNKTVPRVDWHHAACRRGWSTIRSIAPKSHFSDVPSAYYRTRASTLARLNILYIRLPQSSGVLHEIEELSCFVHDR